MSSWAEEEERGGGGSDLGFEGKVSDLQVDEKEQTFGKQILARPLNNSDRAESNKQKILGSSLLVIRSLY